MILYLDIYDLYLDIYDLVSWYLWFVSWYLWSCILIFMICIFALGYGWYGQHIEQVCSIYSTFALMLCRSHTAICKQPLGLRLFSRLFTFQKVASFTRKRWTFKNKPIKLAAWLQRNLSKWRRKFIDLFLNVQRFLVKLSTFKLKQTWK